MFKPIEQTREYKVRQLYAAYVEKHEAKHAQWAPTRLEWQAARDFGRRIFEEKLKREYASKIMQNGTRGDKSGVYVTPDGVYDFCEYFENRGGMMHVKCDRYETLEAFFNFKYPLPRYMWHE